MTSLFNRLARAGLFALSFIFSVGVFASAASNTIPETGADDILATFVVAPPAPPECDGLTLVNIISGSGVIAGSKKADLILASSSVDQVTGDNGNDCIVLYDSADEAYGENGADVILGEAGDDVIYGGNQGDVLYGNGGDDELYGDKHNDTLHGGDGDDLLDGGDGTDTCYGDAGTDTFVNCETIIDA